MLLRNDLAAPNQVLKRWPLRVQQEVATPGSWAKKLNFFIWWVWESCWSCSVGFFLRTNCCRHWSWIIFLISAFEELNMKIRVITRFPLPNFIFCYGKVCVLMEIMSSLFNFWFLIEISETVLIKHHKMHTQVCVPILNFWHWLAIWIYKMLRKVDSL